MNNEENDERKLNLSDVIKIITSSNYYIIQSE